MKSKIVIMALVCILKNSLYAPVPMGHPVPAPVPPASPVYFGGPGMNGQQLFFQAAAIAAAQQAHQQQQSAAQAPEAADLV